MLSLKLQVYKAGPTFNNSKTCISEEDLMLTMPYIYLQMTEITFSSGQEENVFIIHAAACKYFSCYKNL